MFENFLDQRYGDLRYAILLLFMCIPACLPSGMLSPPEGEAPESYGQCSTVTRGYQRPGYANYNVEPKRSWVSRMRSSLKVILPHDKNHSSSPVVNAPRRTNATESPDLHHKALSPGRSAPRPQSCHRGSHSSRASGHNGRSRK